MAGERYRIDRKGMKRRTTLSAIFALSSALGRVIAVVLMIVGVGAIGLLAASLASFFLERRGGFNRRGRTFARCLSDSNGSSANSTGTGSSPRQLDRRPSLYVAMETEWYIGTLSEDGSVRDLAVPITQREREALREAEKAIREAMGGMLFGWSLRIIERYTMSRLGCSGN
jgi:hypothetical protein